MENRNAAGNPEKTGKFRKWQNCCHLVGIRLPDFLRKAELPACCDPDPNVLDAAESQISVKWCDGGEQFTNNYDGKLTHDLLKLLKDIARKTCAAAPHSTSGTEPSRQKSYNAEMSSFFEGHIYPADYRHGISCYGGSHRMTYRESAHCQHWRTVWKVRACSAFVQFQ